MQFRYTRTIDMTPSGEFIPRPAALPWAARIGIGATLVALAAGGVAAAALFLWLASILLPVALVAGVVAYTAFRLQLGRGKTGLMPRG